jgi:peroxiredoxin
VKRTLVVALAVLFGAGIMLLLFRDPIKQAAYDRLTDDMFVAADSDDFDPGPAVGSRFPGLNAVYGGRRIQLLEELAGSRGTVLVASRSLDWCPYCMRQMIQLQAHKPAFDAAGIALVAITYDAPELQQAFARAHGITIPLLSDIDALSFKTLGILNERYQPGDFQYGIPHPGMIVIDPGGEVVGKLFVEAYSKRVDSKAALAFAIEVLGEERDR